MQKLKVFVWYTENVKKYIDLLEKSCETIQDIEIVHCLHNEDVEDKNLCMGETHKESYQNLMLKRWKILPGIIQKNIGTNIVWLDADCVFNENNKIFSTTISNYLIDNDFVFQYDNNSYMVNNINTGIMGIKCSESTLKAVKHWYNDVSTKTQRRPGYPQLEWNEFFNKDFEYKLKFSLLPKEFCMGEGNWVIYHAIGITDPEKRFLKLKNRIHT